MAEVGTTELRRRFAAGLSRLYAREVPAYQQLLDATAQVNAEVVAARGSQVQRHGGIDRVTAERHGAVRVGTPAELRQLGVVLAAFGMHPVGFYDLRGPGAAPVPVVSTAFRPLDPDELEANPFRLFVSVLVPEDRRFFPAELTRRIEAFLSRRRLFGAELSRLATAAAADGGLAEPAAERLVSQAVGCLALSSTPVDRSWYDELQQVSSVAADIAGVPSTHINHLTPRVLDIDLLYRRLQQRGLQMIDRIEGPPRWDGPDVLLRQTSFRALAEPRVIRDPDGQVRTGALRVRFGEVEARGVAVTDAGRDRYEQAMTEAERRQADDPGLDWNTVLAQAWRRHWPASEEQLAAQRLAHFSWRPAGAGPAGRRPPADLAGLVRDGWIEPAPIVYEDFLPRSAAGIFRSNLTSAGAVTAAAGVHRDRDWLAGALERDVADPQALYAGRSEASRTAALAALGLPPPRAAG